MWSREDMSGLACSDTMREKKKKKETLKTHLRVGVVRNEIMKMKMSQPQSHGSNIASL